MVLCSSGDGSRGSKWFYVVMVVILHGSGRFKIVVVVILDGSR